MQLVQFRNDDHIPPRAAQLYTFFCQIHSMICKWKRKNLLDAKYTSLEFTRVPLPVSDPALHVGSLGMESTKINARNEFIERNVSRGSTIWKLVGPIPGFYCLQVE